MVIQRGSMKNRRGCSDSKKVELTYDNAGDKIILVRDNKYPSLGKNGEIKGMFYCCWATTLSFKTFISRN